LTQLLSIKESFYINNSAEPEMDAFIPLEDKNTLHPEQWVKVYGLHSEQYYYIITCQVFQLDAVLGGKPRNLVDRLVGRLSSRIG
jgi:hypothetical protein